MLTVLSAYTETPDEQKNATNVEAKTKKEPLRQKKLDSAATRFSLIRETSEL